MSPRDTRPVDPILALLDDLADDVTDVLDAVDDPAPRDRLVLVANALRNLASSSLAQRPRSSFRQAS